MYEIKINSTGRKDIKSLEKSIRDRIIRKIFSLKENPYPVNVRKIIGTKNNYRIRIGNYRILYEVVDEEKLVKIYRVKHRKEAYR